MAHGYCAQATGGFRRANARRAWDRLMINSAAYRQRLPDPDCPFAVVSLGELERLIAAAQAGDTVDLFRAVTKGDNDVIDVIGQHAQKLGVELEPNSLLDIAFSRLHVPNASPLH